MAFGLSLFLAAAAASAPVTCETAKPIQSAGNHPFYINNEPIEFEGASYVKYGLPRVLSADDVRFAGDYMGVLVAVDAMNPDSRDVIYVLAYPESCEFQPYQKS